MIGSEQSVLARGPLKRRFLKAVGSPDVGEWGRHFFLRKALKRFCVREDVTILDAGCGSGPHSFWLSRTLPRARIVGIDSNQDMIDVCREIQTKERIDNVQFVRGDVTRAILTQKVDLVISIDVLEHIADDDAAIANIGDVLANDGVFVIHVPLLFQRRFLRRLRSWSLSEHVRPGYTYEEITALLAKHGLVVEKSYLTFGPFGELVWEISTLLFHRQNILLALAFPLLLLGVYVDSVVKNSWGNCVLIAGRKG